MIGPMRLLVVLTCMLAAAACRHQQAEPAPTPPDQRRALVLRYCIAPPIDAGPAMSLDEAIQVIEERIADNGVQVHAVDDQIVVELPGSGAQPSAVADVLRAAGPVRQPCP